MSDFCNFVICELPGNGVDVGVEVVSIVEITQRDQLPIEEDTEGVEEGEERGRGEREGREGGERGRGEREEEKA